MEKNLLKLKFFYISHITSLLFLAFIAIGVITVSLFNTYSIKAATTPNTNYGMKVLVLKYFPLTANGQNIDINVTGDVGDPYTTIRQRTISIDNNLIASLAKGTSYLGYKDATAQPSLTYSIFNTKEFTTAVPIAPRAGSPRYPNYNGIMTANNICNYVDVQGVREVWLWAYQGPNKADGQPYLGILESKMSGPFGDISNSARYNDMPICQHTYRVYTFNYGRGTAEAIHSWSHQIESEIDAVNSSLFRTNWQGPNYPQTLGVTGRCGSVHNPANARSEYDWNNPAPQNSDCLNWKADGIGTLTQISCQNWGCADIDDSNNSQLNYIVWNLQNMPGRNNTKTYQGQAMRNWWDVHGNFDTVMASDKTLFLTPNPSPTPTTITMGNTIVGGSVDTNDSNNMNGSKFTMGGTSRSVTSMSVHVANVNASPNNKFQLAIYTDNNGVPGTLVAKSISGMLIANSWNTVPVTANLLANAKYWLIYNSNGTTSAFNNMNYISGGFATWSATQPFGTWPQTYIQKGSSASTFSIYASFNTAPSPTPSPTPIPSSSPIVSPSPIPTASPTPKPSPTPVPTATPAATPIPALSFTSSATVAPISPISGQVATITSKVTANQTKTVLVDVEIYNAAGTKVFQQFWDNQLLTANVTKTYTSNWTPTATGPFTVTVGTFNPGWASFLYWNGNAANGTVR